jgi:myo-inositol 2-dehydrogenase/D-chiro-inositol 1-dehydrogenase
MAYKIGLIGAGRIGRVHAASIAGNARAKLVCVVDQIASSAESLAGRYGATTGTLEKVLGSGIDAVMICSATNTHADLIERAAAAGKAIFCEKPVDLDVARARSCAKRAADAGVPLLIGFNRRFDPHFARLKAHIDAGTLGAVEMVQITSRDPGPPPPDYVRVSGGLFRDMTIHDFDMARWLLGEEPVEVSAAASVLVDDMFKAYDDVDSALVTLRTAEGRLCVISNSRRAAYGYDQRIEVHGSKGMVCAGNERDDLVEIWDGNGSHGSKVKNFFLERYMMAYRRELDHFLDVIELGAQPLVSAADGVRALELADAALISLREGRTVKIT